MAERVVETSLRVRYAETDAMGVVYHANYLVWFEVGRGEYLRALDQTYDAWEREGYLLPVVEAYARYQAPARYGDSVVVRTWVERVRSRSLTLAYEVIDAGTRQLLASGWTRHLCTGHDGQVRRLPQALLNDGGAP
ncbi:MAG TPA: thioesterase family protein [Anaerolineae bacterium]|nr:thioesterase family protein [Anaerolineae bacterium]